MADDPSNHDLDSRIAKAKAAGGSRGNKAGDMANAPGYRQGSKVLAELIGFPIGGGLIGWLLDHWFGTSPWFLLGLLVLSVAAAFWNIIKASNGAPR